MQINPQVTRASKFKDAKNGSSMKRLTVEKHTIRFQDKL